MQSHCVDVCSRVRRAQYLTIRHFSHAHFHCLFATLKNLSSTHIQTHEWGWRPWDLLMLFEAAMLWIHKKPRGTPGRNGALDMLFVEMAQNVQQVGLMQLKGETSMNMYCMLMPQVMAVDSSCYWKQRTQPPIATHKRKDYRRTYCQCSLMLWPWGQYMADISIQGDTCRCSPGSACSLDSTEVCSLLHCSTFCG